MSDEQKIDPRKDYVTKDDLIEALTNLEAYIWKQIAKELEQRK